MPWAEDAVEWATSSPLKVLVLGPGSNSPGADKRLAIAEHLVNLNREDEVSFAEDIIAGSETLGRLRDSDGLYAAKLALVRTADSVVALVVEDPSVTGVLVELSQFLLHTTLRHKFLVIEPYVATSLMKSKRGPYSLDQLSRLDSQQRFSYRPQQLASCTAIRSWLEQRLTGFRAQKAEMAMRA